MVARLVEGAPGSIAGTPVRAASSLDGARYLLAGDSWLLIRPGDTTRAAGIGGVVRSEDGRALLGYGESVADA